MRPLLYLRLRIARSKLAALETRCAELAASVEAYQLQPGQLLRAMVAGYDLTIATRDAAAWRFEVEALEQELAQPGPVRRVLARGARWCSRLERANARLWEGRANALEGPANATASADARERAYEHAREADSWEVTAERLEGRAPSAHGVDA